MKFLTNLFKNLKKSNPSEPTAHLPSQKTSSIFNIPIPSGTKINKTVLFSVLFIIIILISYSLYAVTEKPKAKKTEENTNTQNIKTTQTNPFDNLPNSYSDKIKTENSRPVQQTQSKIPIPTAPPSPPAVPQMSKQQQAELNARLQAQQKLYQEEELAIKSKINVIDKKKAQDANIAQIQQLDPVAADFDQNQQSSKLGFMNNTKLPNLINAQAIVPSLSKYLLQAGSNIPCVLLTGINTDLPGNIVAQVSENIYDTTSGEYLLIPQGAKLIGKYDSKVSYGQYRVLLIWQRLMLPNGKSILLENMQGADTSGYSGLRDNVDKHTPDLIRGVVLSALLSSVSMAATSSHNDNSYQNDFKVAAGQGAAQAILDVGGQITQKNLDRQPTLKIRPGHQFMVMVHQDLILEPYN